MKAILVEFLIAKCNWKGGAARESFQDLQTTPIICGSVFYLYFYFA